MASRIFKYVVRINQVAEIQLDPGAEVLSVGLQYDDHGRDVVVFYAFHDDDQPKYQRRKFTALGTGWPVPEGAVHHGTVRQGSFAWHLMELPS